MAPVKAELQNSNSNQNKIISSQFFLLRSEVEVISTVKDTVLKLFGMLSGMGKCLEIFLKWFL